MRAPTLFKIRLILVPSFIALCMGACAYRTDKSGAGAAPDARDASNAPAFAQVRDQVFAAKCTTCHHHQNDFKDYAKTFAEREEIQQKVFVDRSMPEGDVLTADQSAMLKKWLDSGAPEQAGQPTAVPTPPTSPDPERNLAPTWDNVQKHFFTPYCTSCHSGDTPKGDVDLTDLSQLRSLQSKIMDRVFFNTDKPMPPKKDARDKITPEEKMLLINWFAAKMPGPDGTIEQPAPAPTTVTPPTPPTPPTPAPAPTLVLPPAPLAPGPVPTQAPPRLIPTFAMVRAQVFSVNCSTCHYHESDFSNFSDTRSEIDDIREKVLVEHSMPESGHLSADQLNLLQLWIAGGALE